MEGKAGALTLTKRIRVNGVPAEASLAADGTLRWRAGDGGERCLAVESEVLGFEAEGQRITLRAFVGASRGASCGGVSFGKRTRRDYVLELPTEEPVLQWSQRLRDCIKSLETKYQLHAQEIARSLGLLKYDGIVCVSGDGVLVEVVNGLLQREDWDTAIKVPLGIIPAGTGNGMAKSLLDSVGDLYSVSNATFAVIRGHKRTLDVATVLQGEKKFFSVLMLTWGLVADIDIESEKYRWMGSARLDFYSLLRMMNLRRYHGHVQFVPAPGYESYGEPIKQNGSDMGNTVLPEQGRVNNAEVKSCGYPGPVASFDGLEWRSIDGPFISVWINNVPWAGEDIMPAPEAKFSDGCLDAAILRDCPKSALLGLMLKMSDGSYLKSPYVIYLKVKAFRLKPGQRVGNPTKGGIVDSDGEVIAMGDRVNGGIQQEYRMSYGPPLQLTVDQGLATIFSPR
ncbi:sphingosine kinase 2-like isoform X2 [Phoenix dactylifera]|uniref:Sphingosine kinase 2-like isoform X2 n=1 Tax=Phoenix dactylifera TaxID=42345 RepID=A0A8B9ALT3_PHODC|nr:sphingosine kinase 2-like isoform X2 [Phoenix dactylifera]